MEEFPDSMIFSASPRQAETATVRGVVVIISLAKI
jgi:hypothetical protein